MRTRGWVCGLYLKALDNILRNHQSYQEEDEEMELTALLKSNVPSFYGGAIHKHRTDPLG